MNMILELNKTALRVSLALTMAALAPALPATAGEAASTGVKPYPLKKCVVDGKRLQKSGKVHTLTYQDREIKLCCNNCTPKFEQHASKYLGKIKRAENKAAETSEPAGLPSALDTGPGGLAWPGW